MMSRSIHTAERTIPARREKALFQAEFRLRYDAACAYDSPFFTRRRISLIAASQSLRGRLRCVVKTVAVPAEFERVVH